MKAILLAGGKGTRLRPLTIHTPKPIVPIFARPFLHYQLDLLKQIPDIDEVVLSLNYQPRRIEELFGDGSDTGLSIRYVVEPALDRGRPLCGESLLESVTPPTATLPKPIRRRSSTCIGAEGEGDVV